jgi:hypothetical protein
MEPMTVRKCAVLTLLLALAALAPAQMFAHNGDRVQFFQSFTVGPDEEIDSAVCIFCSIHVEGRSGDTVAILGDLVIDGNVTGDAVSVGGGIKMSEDSHIAGDAVAIGKGLYRPPSATVKGEQVSQSGPIVYFGLWFGLLIVPLLPIILVVSLIVWLVRRDRYAPRTQVAYRR